MQNANTTDVPRTEPPTDRVATPSAPPPPPLKLDAEEIEERIVPVIW